jgi:hypothetical protein
MFVVMYAGRTFSSFKAIAFFMVALSITLSAICIHMGQGEFQCILLELNEKGEVDHDRSRGEPDGRACEESHWCERSEGALPNRDYECEKPGLPLFKAFTVAHGRVRWRGTLADPNELSLAAGAAMSFCFAIHANMRRKIRHVLLAAVIGTVLYCVQLTGSRGGVTAPSGRRALRRGCRVIIPRAHPGAL